MRLYRKKNWRNDIECKKTRYHLSCFFADLFCKSTHHLANCWLHDASFRDAKLSTWLWGLSKQYFSASNRSSYYNILGHNNYLIMSCYTLRYLPYLPFLGNVQHSNSHKWHPTEDDISAIIGSLKTTRVFFQPPRSRRCSNHLCNKNRAVWNFFKWLRTLIEDHSFNLEFAACNSCVGLIMMLFSPEHGLCCLSIQPDSAVSLSRCNYENLWALRALLVNLPCQEI